MNYQVTVKSRSRINIIDVNSRTIRGSIADSIDVDSSNRQNNSVLIWNETTQKHEYVHPSEILDRADNVNDDSLDYGSY
jgi:hypothetical protein